MFSRTEAGGQGGFLLLEALIALAIIGIVAIALLAATSSQVQASGKANALLVASALAQDRFATIQMLDGDQLRDPPDSLTTGIFPAPFDEFRWTAAVDPADNEYDLFAVRIEVDGRGESFRMETLVHRSSSVILTVGGQGQ
ncbi:MAG TPA: hypothetical protein VMN39_03040 [Longimicrobiaceae bacterium]|nr:hypothetical protein [Longimicrobiaceae bacterium]